MKILHVYKSYYPETTGGVEQCIRALCIGLREAGVQSDVAVCTKNLKSAASEEGYQVYRFKKTFEMASCPFSISFFTDFKKLSKNYDLIHYHFPWPFQDILSLRQSSQTPYVVTYHSDIVRQKYLNKFYEPLMRHFLKGAAKIIATSPPYKETSSVLRDFADKTQVIPIGTSPHLYPPLENERAQQWKARFGDAFILFIGVLRYYKGLEFLLQAAREIEVPIVIAGTGPEEAALKAEAQAMNLKHVQFVGFVGEADKMALLSLSKAVVAPAHLRSEAFCIALLEGLMSGKPLISTELGTGTSYVNQHQKTGLVVPPADGHALAEAMRTLYDYPAEYAKYVTGARAYYFEEFSLDKMIERYIACYKTVLNQSA